MHIHDRDVHGGCGGPEHNTYISGWILSLIGVNHVREIDISNTLQLTAVVYGVCVLCV